MIDKSFLSTSKGSQSSCKFCPLKHWLKYLSRVNMDREIYAYICTYICLCFVFEIRKKKKCALGVCHDECGMEFGENDGSKCDQRYTSLFCVNFRFSFYLLLPFLLVNQQFINGEWRERKESEKKRNGKLTFLLNTQEGQMLYLRFVMFPYFIYLLRLFLF